ncbi:MAG TPA: hypothetical protein PLI17_11270, partial [Denitromonas sp.]|nr:hypothetical protein [Denitromonas sp.]
VAVSTTPDPTGTYYRYAFSTGSNFPDYPKYGWWSDALYISTREFAGSNFAGVGAYAVNRAELIAGNPAPTVISFLVPPGAAPYNVGDGLLPADIDGSTLPPAGSPEYYMGAMDNGGSYGAPQDALTLWKFVADFATPANSSFTLANTIPIAAYDTFFPCTPTSRSCIAQPGTSNKLDHQGYRQRPLFRLAYRNFGSHESLVTNQSVEAATNVSGIRWWEVRSPNSSPVLYQDSTYAPGVADGIQRWMGSIAMDGSGNMALGYSASDGTNTYPSVWYTGRLASDPLNTMPQGEGSIINGTGSQTGSQRWGDYTAMTVDPVDDCTFWYVNEYVPTTSSVGWQLRIGAFKFNECGQVVEDPNIDVSPLSMASTQATNTTTQQNLAVGNTGQADLTWNIFEDVTGAPELVDWSDNFDSYATGSQLIGQGGWEGWDGSAAAGALTSNAQALSAPNSADILGATDLVHQYSGYTSGKWVYTAMQYIPNDFVGQTYFILLNTYVSGNVNADNWSTQLCFDSATGQVNDDVPGSCSGTNTLPLVTGQWVEIRVEIDLDADTQAIYYNNQLLVQDTWTGHVSGGGALNIGAVDLFANGASSVFYDDMSLAAPGQAVACDAPADIPWASVSPDNGTTTPGNSTNVQVTFDSTGLADGVYTGNLCVTSNDPDPGPGNGTDLVIVPLTLTVQPPTAVTLSSIDADAAQSPVPMAGLPLGAVAAAGLSMAAAAGYALKRRNG